MISDYQYGELEKTLNSDLEKSETLIKLWGNVSYQTKKNGEPFKTLSKNITGAEVRPKGYATHAYEKELIVSDWTKDGQFVADIINLYVPIRYASESYLKKIQNMDDGIYCLDLADIKICIADKIEYWNKMHKIYEDGKEHLREICEVCDNMQQKLKSSMSPYNYNLAVNYMKYIL